MDHLIVFFLVSWEASRLMHTVGLLVSTFTESVKFFISLHLWRIFVTLILILTILLRIIKVILIWISLIMKDIKHFKQLLSSNLYSMFWEFFSSMAQFLIVLFIFLMVSIYILCLFCETYAFLFGNYCRSL